MCISAELLTDVYQGCLDDLLDAGLLIASGVPGVYGRSGAFEAVVDGFDRFATREATHLAPEVMRFPPLLNRRDYLLTDHLQTFPNLMGSVHTFTGNERDHLKLLQSREAGEDWTRELAPTEVMLTPAACYPLYPTASGSTLTDGGRLVDLTSFVFRHEPSPDPARMQIFRQREFVRLGTPEQALTHRDEWLARGERMLRAVGLDVTPVVANDPFFGRGGRVMAATQKEQALKFELVVPIASAEKPTAVTSCNLHLDHFGHTFNIRRADGGYAHTACIGFGLERIALALFKTHGFETENWPGDVKRVLTL